MPESGLTEYALAHTTAEAPILARLNRETHLSQVYPQMLPGHLQGSLLRMITLMLRPQRILEIGTFTGYSAINLAQCLVDDGLLHTVEINPEQEEMIRKFIAASALEQRISLHIGDALQIIPALNETWDLVYIDADKPNYLKYYTMIFNDLRSGGFILADNTLWDGKVLQDRKTMNKDTRGIVEFNEFIQQDIRVENMLLPFRDGIMMVRKL